MHELSLLENVKEIVEEYALNQQFKKVSQITLEIGVLSCIEPDALRFGFDVVMQGTLAEQAELILLELAGQGVCQRCHQSVSMKTLYEPCQFCGHPFITITQGTEMRIKDLLVS